MASSPSVRASDADRDRTADLLREHHARGRLDPEEFAERLDRVFAAKTIDDLDELTADLPAIDLYPLPSASLPRTRAMPSGPAASSALGQAAGQVRIWRGSAHGSTGWVAAWGSWSAVMMVLLVLLAVSGNAWPLLWGAAAGMLMGGRWVIRHRAIGRGESGQLRGQLGQPPPDQLGSSDDEQ
jgi:hypothetical protein